MATPITSPLIPTYASRTSYLTPAEYTASPTGVDVSQLVVGGTTQQNADALLQTIARASSMVDETTKQVLAATIDTQTGSYRVDRDGYLNIKLDNTPIIQVNDVAVGITPDTVASLTSLTGLWIGKKVIKVPILNRTFAPTGFGSDRLYAVVKYVNGYANCLLTAPAAQGAQTITVDNPLGLIPGLTPTIYDPGASEQVTVTAVNGNTVTLATPLVSAHAVGVSVSALPPKVKQAAVLYTSALIKTRTEDAYEMPTLGGQPSQVAHGSELYGPDVELADWLLMSLIRTA